MTTKERLLAQAVEMFAFDAHVFLPVTTDNIIATGIRYTLVRLVRARSNPIYKSLCYVGNERGTFFNRRPQSCLQFLGQKSLALIIVGESKHVVARLLIVK